MQAYGTVTCDQCREKVERYVTVVAAWGEEQWCLDCVRGPAPDNPVEPEPQVRVMEDEDESWRHS